jgi:hypothetical protein
MSKIDSLIEEILEDYDKRRDGIENSFAWKYDGSKITRLKNLRIKCITKIKKILKNE